MNHTETPVEQLFENTQDYGTTAIELFWLKTINKSADFVSSLVVRLVIIVVLILFVFILNIGISLWIGDLIGKTYLGFFVVAGFYAIVLILIQTFGHPFIKIPISNAIITKLLEQKNL